MHVDDLFGHFHAFKGVEFASVRLEFGVVFVGF